MAGAAAPPPPRRGGGDDRYRGGFGLAGGRRGVVRPHRLRARRPPLRGALLPLPPPPLDIVLLTPTM